MTHLAQKNKRILIADDTPEYLHLLKRILTSQGFLVDACSDGSQALDSALRNPPDLIMLDISMPVLDGVETCLRLKAEACTKEIPVIFLSGLQEVEDKVKAFQAGGVDYVIKPFQVDEVLARLRTHLAIRGLQTELQQTNLDLARRLKELGEAQAAEKEQRILAETLRDSIAAINSTLDYDEVLDLILKNLERVVHSDASSIALIDENHLVSVKHSRGYEQFNIQEYIQSIQVPADHFPNWKTVIRDRLVLSISDTETDPNWVSLPVTAWIRSYICAPIINQNQVIGILNLDSSTPDFFHPHHAERVRAFADQAAIAIEKANLFRETQRLAITDGLTGIFNNRHVRELAESELNRSRRYGREVSAIFFDIDHFKQINDQYGHQTGDLALREITELCRSLIRESDILGRYGGEEFLIIAPETGEIEVMKIAERIRQSLEEHRIMSEFGEIQLTISLGVVCYEPGMALTFSEFIRRADQALYQAKNQGRNRACCWTPALAESSDKIEPM